MIFILFFCHNANNNQNRSGVVIISSPRYTEAWKGAGGLEPTTTTDKFEGRFIGTTIKFSLFNNK